MTESIIDALPLGAILALTVVFGLAAIEAGYRCGARRLRTDGMRELEAPVGAMVGATLGLLVFFLAFVFGMVSNRYDVRRTMLVDDVNAIGTTWLRTSFLPEPQQATSRQALREYVDLRLSVERQDVTPALLAAADGLTRRLWQDAVVAGKGNAQSEMTALYVDSLNHMIDLHTSRLQAGARSRIPDVIWWALLVLTVLGFVTMGYHSGVIGARRSPVSVVVALTVGVMVLLIAELDNPRKGLLKLSQQPMIELRASMDD